jgi:large subunit ribosomal protein L30
MAGDTIRITYVKSSAGYTADQEQTIRSLGLHRLHQTIERPDTPDVRGMIAKVSHLVEIHDDTSEAESEDA